MVAGEEKKTILLLIFCCLIVWGNPGSARSDRLDINTATTDELTSLPYIGSRRAEIIRDCRKEQGPFQDLIELEACKGIGPDTLKAMRSDLEAIGGEPGSTPSAPANLKEEKTSRLKSAPGDILILADSEYFPVLLKKIRAARNSIDLTMFVFKTTNSSNNRPRLVVEELRAAASRGVKVRVFLEKSGYDKGLNETNLHTAEILRGKGIEVFFDSPGITTHGKLVVMDHRFSFVGSHNLTHAALTYNNELSLLIDDPALAKSLTAYMEGIASQQ
ncbi:MAG: phospholipase D-like domain-containing protein [Desulfurivibrionaceae bacterium]